jgi:hypothetical protein
MKMKIQKKTSLINKQTQCPAAVIFSPTKLAALPAALAALPAALAAAAGIACTVSTTCIIISI